MQGSSNRIGLFHQKNRHKHTVIGKAYLLTDPGRIFTPEKIASREYFIHLKNESHKKPFVIVLDTTNAVKDNGKVYEEAKT
jgi:alpha-L-fucosidase